MSDCQGATITLVRGVEISAIVFWHDSGSPGRNSHVDSWRWESRKRWFGTLQDFEIVVFQQGTSFSEDESW
eukprot:7460050-Pyramimonas_sp.AAC.1